MRFGDKAIQYCSKAAVQRKAAAWCGEWLEEDASNLEALEFGAGAGLFTDHLLRKGFARVVASDLSARMVEEGRRRYPSAEWQTCNAWKGMEGCFDSIYSCSLLQWAWDPEKVLRNWRRSLREEGRLLVSLFVAGSIEELAEGDARFAAVRFRESTEWVSLMEKAGYSVERFEERVWRERHDSALAALRSMHEIGAVEEGRWKLGALRRFLKERDEARREKDGFPLTWKALKVSARRA